MSAPARERLEAALATLAARAADERVFLKVYADQARAAADAADDRARSGTRLGPLDGVVVSIKDLFDVAGEPTLSGSTIMRSAAPAARDAVAVTRLREAGAVVIGKTNMCEFAFNGVGLNPHYGTPGNAVDPSRIPGGSSSGAGVSVAEGTSAVSIGSDTGGSIRIPAALNGIVGFKPTMRRIDMGGVFPLSPSLDSIGPLARTVRECADTDAVLAGERPQPLASIALKEARIGIPRGYLMTETEVDVARAFDASLSELHRRGAEIVDIDIEDLLSEMRDITRADSIASTEGAEIHADWLMKSIIGVDPRVSGALLRRMAVPAWSYLRVMRRRGELARAMDERLRRIDMLALPTTPVVAPLIEPLVGSDALFSAADDLLLRNPTFVNQFDMTAISLPMPGLALPAGLMLVARHGEDRRLLAMAEGVEKALS